MSVSIDINQAGTDASPEFEAVIAQAVRATLAHHEVEHASISVTLMGDIDITAMNVKYLQHDHVTDVMAFPLYAEGENPVGDIYIGWEQAKRQAADAGVSLQEETGRLAIHGALHVLGYGHPGTADPMQSEMWQLQELILRNVNGQ